jgi:hypothetical protein
MENINEDIGQPFWEVMTNKVEKQEQRIIDLEKKASAVPDYSQDISRVVNKIEDVKDMVRRVSIPEKEIHLLNSNLNKAVGYLSQPMHSKVEHHHYIPNIIVISAILFIIICALISGWIITYQNLDQYKENDTKYRFLKVQGNKPLQDLLFITDSLYNAQSNLRENVIHQEDSILERFKRLQEIDTKEKEIKALKKRVEYLVNHSCFLWF